MDKIPLAVIPSIRRPLRPECAPDPLRDLLAAHVGATMACFLDPARISALAQDLRVVQRERVHDAGLVVCALVLSAFARSTDTQGRFLDAQQTYRGLGGPDSTPRSFRNMVRKLLPVLREMLKRCLRKLVSVPKTAPQARRRCGDRGACGSCRRTSCQLGPDIHDNTECLVVN